MKKRLTSLALSIILMLSLCLSPTLAAGTQGGPVPDDNALDPMPGTENVTSDAEDAPSDAEETAYHTEDTPFDTDTGETPMPLLTDTETTELLSDESDASPLEGRFPFSSYVTRNNETAPFTFDENWFFRPAKANYQGGLARMSIRAAMAAFGAYGAPVKTEGVVYHEEEGETSNSANLVGLMQALGFSRIETHYPVPGPDTIGYAIASREIHSGDGESANLLLIAVRGGNYGQEWASNFTMGTNAEHQGFAEAGDTVFEGVRQYISEHFSDSTGTPLKLWITGYSRAAATANIAAQRLTRLAADTPSANFTENDVFAYCFACPRNVILSEVADPARSYDNIVNVVNYMDLVPKVANDAWGYQRYGVTYYLPSVEYTATYADAAQAMRTAYMDYLASVFPNWPTENLAAVVNGATAAFPGQGRFTDRFLDIMAAYVGPRDTFVSEIQETVRASILSGGGDDMGSIFTGLLGAIPGFYGTHMGMVMTFSENGAPIGNAHGPEGYLAWLDALDTMADLDGTALLRPGAKVRALVVNGPLDLTVYDASGSPVAQFQDNTPLSVSGSALSAYLDNYGQKIVMIPVDGAYRVELTAAESGTAGYQIEETDLDTGVTTRLASYRAFSVEAGDRLTGEVENLAEDPVGQYSLTSAVSGPLTPDRDAAEPIEDCVVSVAMEERDGGSGAVLGGGYAVWGEWVRVQANPGPNTAFLGWYEDNRLVSDQSRYSFPVTRNIRLTAVFSTDRPECQVTVTGGTGSGAYKPGASVCITADEPPEGMVFDHWNGAENLNFLTGGAKNAVSIFAMPEEDVTLTAEYRTRTAEGCYVATAVYGSYDSPPVRTLRQYRDTVLKQTWEGRLFIRLYYAVSPTAVRYFGDTACFRDFFRGVLDPWVADLQERGYASAPGQSLAG